MNVGIVGLGRMGMGMGTRLVRRGHTVAGHDTSQDKRVMAEANGIRWWDAPSELCSELAAPRVVITMVPAGAAVDSVIDELAKALSSGDIIIDGGNSFYRDSIERAELLNELGLRFLDVGISGGVWGLEKGYCLMAGGDHDAYKIAEPALLDLAQEGGCAYLGKSGAGHFAKMVHNGIEYGMMQAYGEGFEILNASDFDYDLASLADLWNHGGVVRSWLLELAKLAFDESPGLEHMRGWVEDSGEGRWVLEESIEQRVPAPVIALSLMMRFRSRQDDSFSAKVVAALRKQFGGHAVKES